MGISELIANTRRRTPAKVQPDLQRKIERDLKAVVAADNDGKPVPGSETLTKYLNTEYGVAVSRHTTKKWLDAVRKGGRIQ